MDKFVKLDQREHVLARPSMYICSIESDKTDTWVFDEAENRIVKRTIDYIAGLYKIFDEIVVNAIDHSIRLADTEAKRVLNDGVGLPAGVHPEYKIHVPELVFGHLPASTNYDDTEERTIGGMNGLGSKVTSIFSKEFVVQTVDSNEQQLYQQTFYCNMTDKTPPKLTPYKKYPFTSIRFLPD
eukprot:gene19590-biopygen28426